MDILGIVNEFINNKEEIDYSMVVSELNEGKSEKAILKDFNISGETLHSKLEEQGYYFSEVLNRWESKKNKLEKNYSQDNKVYENGNNETPYNKIQLDRIINRLNSGEGFVKIAKSDGLQVVQISNAIKGAGYRFDSFFKTWTKLSEDKFYEYIISELNKGKTIYDLSNNYMRNKKERLLFADELRRKIEKKGYHLDKTSKIWVLDTINIKVNSNELKDERKESKKTEEEITAIQIIDKLNRGATFSDIESETGLDFHRLRLILKREGFKLNWYLC
ncbi:hypothetical protein V7112_06320, partial [Bacillus sp. JJ1566]|uniref:hypothetical protein n=1 Tax=Bacillus sp. JJ1566 TaxID=3122961 RepID=UPI002FFE58BA